METGFLPKTYSVCNGIQSEVKTKKMISQKRLAYTAVVVSISLMLGFIAPTFIPAVAAVNSHSASISATIGADPNGPGYESFWTSNVTHSMSLFHPAPGTPTTNWTIKETSVGGTTTTWLCGSFGFDSRPASNSSQTTTALMTPAPGEVLLVVDLAPYCHVING